jgi:hypothetical protein
MLKKRSICFNALCLTLSLETYQEHIGIRIKTDSPYALPNNRGSVLPWLSNSVANHLLCLATVQLRLRRLTWNDNANLCRKIHRVLTVAAVNHWKFRLFQDYVVCCVAISELLEIDMKTTY